MRNLGTERSTEDPAGVPPVDRLEAVVPTVSAPILGGTAAAAAAAEAAPPDVVADEAHDVPRAMQPQTVYLQVAGVTIAAVAVAALDVRLGLMFGALICAGAGMRSIDRHIPFSFGEGFVGHRSDPAWPRGVQEDDDVHWHWMPGRSGRQADRP